MFNSNQLTCIEGNIGSGKTTLFNKLKEYYKSNSSVIFVEEPVNQWVKIKDKEGNTMLKKFYENQEKYAFPFQMMAFISRLSLLNKVLKENKNAIIISERSLYTDKFVFAKMLHDKELIEDVNYQIYNSWFEEFARTINVDNIIYVKTDPAICSERINIRAREGESTISLEYLKDCHKYHEDMLKDMSSYSLYKNKIVLDGNEDVYKDPFTFNKWINQIDQLILKNKNKSDEKIIYKKHIDLFIECLEN